MAGGSGISDFLPYQRSCKLPILAVNRRTPLLQAVPPFAQAGTPSLDRTSEFLGLSAPLAESDAIVARYNTAQNKVLADPGLAAMLQDHAMTVSPGTPADQAQQLTQATRTLSTLVQRSGILPQ